MRAGAEVFAERHDAAATHSSTLETHPQVARRIVFVTGGAFSARAQEFLRTTTNATVSKPFDPIAIGRIVADYIAAPLPPRPDAPGHA